MPERERFYILHRPQLGERSRAFVETEGVADVRLET